MDSVCTIRSMIMILNINSNTHLNCIFIPTFNRKSNNSNSPKLLYKIYNFPVKIFCIRRPLTKKSILLIIKVVLFSSCTMTSSKSDETKFYVRFLNNMTFSQRKLCVWYVSERSQFLTIKTKVSKKNVSIACLLTIRMLLSIYVDSTC